MKPLILSLLSFLVVTSTYANQPDVNGAGMYCSIDAQAGAIKKASGATQADIDGAITVSLEPDQGDVYQTNVGKRSFFVRTTASDGVCKVAWVQELLLP